MEMTPRIGIFGGTFDPIHVGHLVAAVNTRHDLDLDRVVMMVANVPWQKAGERKVSPAEDRFEMVRTAVGDVEGLEASRMEIDRGGPSYTADTVAQYAALHPGAELFVIVGWDVGSELQSWERLDEVRDLASLVVVNRPGTPPPAGLRRQGWRLCQVTVPNLEISSTDLRARAATGRPLDYLVPGPAVRVIRERSLYSVSG
jgi:nicotinate-nucleotide adenylyltransferase